MTLPLSILLIPLALFLLFFVILSLINIAHLIKFAAFDMGGFWACFLFIAGSALFLYFAWGLISSIDWRAPVQFSLGGWNQIPSPQ
jgi:hypothetical protein